MQQRPEAERKSSTIYASMNAEQNWPISIKNKKSLMKNKSYHENIDSYEI